LPPGNKRSNTSASRRRTGFHKTPSNGQAKQRQWLQTRKQMERQGDTRMASAGASKGASRKTRCCWGQ
jgi:hypothetical protein